MKKEASAVKIGNPGPTVNTVMPEFGKGDFWDHHYGKNTQPFDWLFRWDSPNGVHALKDNLIKHFKEDAAILIIGCGTSRLTEDLAYEGYDNITSIDYSSTCIEIMKEKYKDDSDLKDLKFLKMDATKMTDFKNG